ncbi:hypothetical protein [Dasania marina]|uniref:hypothetical protein n=1 Tax=Dasania marina TaxID=471499 RepID=UPI000475E056|nr:hypothetical protein [Dasania marina]
MSYTIDFDQIEKIVTVTYSKTVSLADRIMAVNDVCSSCADITPLKILVDVRNLVMHLKTREQKDFAVFLSSNPLLKRARIAVLHEATFNPNVIIDTIAFNNGYKLAQFNRKNDAVVWLNEIG